MLVFIALYLGDSVRSYIVQADTFSARVVFVGSTSKPWQVSSLTLCQRRTGRISAGAIDTAAAQAPCSSALYDAIELQNQIIEWPNGVAVRILRAGPDGGIEIHIQPSSDAVGQPHLLQLGEHPVGAQDVLIIPETVWKRDGSLLFSGYLTIGAEPTSGIRDHLIAGNYEVRETLFLRARPVSVLRGDFFSGDEVTIFDAAGGDAETVTGFIQPSPNHQGEAMRIVAYSSLGDGQMRIGRLGATPSIVRPNWMDRAINDPTLLALTGLLAFAVAILELIKGIRAIRTRGTQFD